MGWPKHNYAYVVLHGDSALRLVRESGCGNYYPGGFGEVFLSKKAAHWIANDLKKTFQKLADCDAQGARETWLLYKKRTRVLKIALPGTYPQVQAPSEQPRRTK
jgi:hypothetical protein